MASSVAARRAGRRFAAWLYLVAPCFAACSLSAPTLDEYAKTRPGDGGSGSAGLSSAGQGNEATVGEGGEQGGDGGETTTQGGGTASSAGSPNTAGTSGAAGGGGASVGAGGLSSAGEGGTAGGYAGSGGSVGSGGSAGAGGRPTVELARGKATTASTEESGNPSSYANDGVPTTRWAASSGTLPQWWRVDLGRLYTLQSYTLTFQWSDREYSYTIETSTNGSTFANPQAKSGTGVQSGAFPATQARYVRVTVTASSLGSFASLAEVSIQGY